MRKHPTLWTSVAWLGVLIMGSLSASSRIADAPDEAEPVSGAWQRAREARAGARPLTIALVHDAARSEGSTQAVGSVEVDLPTGRVRAEVVGLPEGAFDLWLVDRGPARARAGSTPLRVGRLERDGAHSRLVRELGPDAFLSMQVDFAAVAAADRGPDRALLYGSVPLAQRLYTVGPVPVRLAALSQAMDVPRQQARTRRSAARSRPARSARPGGRRSH